MRAPALSGVSHAQIAQPGGFGKMRSSFDFAPYRSSAIGFDRLFDLLETDQRGDGSEGYPPFDLSRQGVDSYRITLAVAGFRPERSEERRVGTECVSTCRSRWWP